MKYSRRLFFLQLIALTACRVKSIEKQSQELLVGVVSYDEGEQTITQYTNFNQYLSEKTGAIVKLEPVFNENKALERIRNRDWSLFFAPSGLAAIAIAQKQYIPISPLEDINNSFSIFVVRKDNPIRNIKQLQSQTVALSQPGSATGYFLPIYNLYGLTLSELMLAPTPKTVLKWVAQKKATAGALSREEFNYYSPQFNPIEFRILYTDPHKVPLGIVFVAPNVEIKLQNQIRQAMSEAPSIVTQDAGYIPNRNLPDYS